MIWQTVFSSLDGCVTWVGKTVDNQQEFEEFLQGPVAARLNDEEGKALVRDHLYGLDLTEMGTETLEEVLNAEVPEERDWAAGEALAEAVLEDEYNVVFPWNMERDKRNPHASLPGADIVGLQRIDDTYCFALGEVKSSSDNSTPPNVMYGRSGMVHQLDELATNLSKVFQLIKWLLYRVENTDYKLAFDQACTRYFNSSNKDLILFGVLIRDREPTESDLQARGRSLAESLEEPTYCHLIALYLPLQIANLPQAIRRGGAA